MNIAVMPGDGVGKEVVPEGLKVLKAAAEKFGFTYTTTDYPHGAEHYLADRHHAARGRPEGARRRTTRSCSGPSGPTRAATPRSRRA